MATANPYIHHVEITGPRHRRLSMIEWEDLCQTMGDWCVERFGPRLGTHLDDRPLDLWARWYSRGSSFHFIEPSHAVEFKMVWG